MPPDFRYFNTTLSQATFYWRILAQGCSFLRLQGVWRWSRRLKQSKEEVDLHVWWLLGMEPSCLLQSRPAGAWRRLWRRLPWAGLLTYQTEGWRSSPEAPGTTTCPTLRTQVRFLLFSLPASQREPASCCHENAFCYVATCFISNGRSPSILRIQTDLHLFFLLSATKTLNEWLRPPSVLPSSGLSHQAADNLYHGWKRLSWLESFCLFWCKCSYNFLLASPWFEVEMCRIQLEGFLELNCNWEHPCKLLDKLWQ